MGLLLRRGILHSDALVQMDQEKGCYYIPLVVHSIFLWQNSQRIPYTTKKCILTTWFWNFIVHYVETFVVCNHKLQK